MITISERTIQESAKDYALRVLMDNIIHLRLIPGEKLPEQELCQRLGISRTPFREAELELAQRKLIDIRPKIGTYVSYIDTELVEEVRHLRSVLEGEIAVMACRMLTKRDVDRLWTTLALWKVYINRQQEDGILRLDKAFHGMLYQLCGRRHWLELVEHIAPSFDRATILSFRCCPPQSTLQDHEQLVQAIQDRDEDRARQIARRHLYRYTEYISSIQSAFPDYFKDPAQFFEPPQRRL